jgi:plastocyanin
MMQEVHVKLTEFNIKPDEIHVKAGEPVLFTVDNSGRIDHDFFVEEIELGIKNLKPGETKSFEHVFSEPKIYTTICHHFAHSQLGMRGKLIVE